MLRDARIEVDHVGEWTCQQASGCQHAIPGFCYIGQRECSLPNYEHYIAVKNRLQVQNFNVCVVKEERLMHAQQHCSSFPTTIGGGWAWLVLCIKTAKCRVEDDFFLSIDSMLLRLSSEYRRPVESIASLNTVLSTRLRY